MDKMLIDPNALDQYIEVLGDEANELIAEIIDTLLDDASNQFAFLDQSLKDNDPATFQRAAHTLKSNCKTVGATEYAEIFYLLEEKGASGDISSVSLLLEKSKEDYPKLKDELLKKKESLK